MGKKENDLRNSAPNDSSGKCKDNVAMPENYKELLKPLWISVFVDILGFTIILPFIPFFAMEYNATTLQTGLLISSNAIFGFVFSNVFGSLSDKYGRKPLILIAQGGTLVSFLILSFSNSLGMLFLARIVDGIFGGQFPISKAIIGDVVPKEERGRQMTNIGLAFALASLVGPAAGAFLSRFGIIGPGLLAVSLSAFTIGFTALKLKETNPKVLKDAKKPVYIREELPNGETAPVDGLEILKKPKTYLSWLPASTKHLIAEYSVVSLIGRIFETTLSIYAFMRLGLDEEGLGTIFTIMAIFQIVFRGLAFAKIAKSLGDVKTSMTGLIIMPIALSSLMLVTQQWHLITVVVLYSLGRSLSNGILNGLLSRSVNQRNQGKINGISSSIDNLAQIFAPIIGTALLGAAIANLYGLVLVILACLSAIMHIRVFKFSFRDDEEKCDKEENRE